MLRIDKVNRSNSKAPTIEERIALRLWKQQKRIQRPFKPHKRWLQSQTLNAKRVWCCRLLWHRVTMRRTKWSNVYARKKMCDASQSTMEIRNKLNNTLFISFHCTIDWSNRFVRISFHSRRKTAIKRFLWLYFRLFKHHFRESFFFVPSIQRLS